AYQKLAPLKEIYPAWKKIRLKSVRFVMGEQAIDMLIVPEEFEYQERKISGNLPAGMLFFLKKDKIYFSVQVLIDKNVIKINEEYKGEEALLKSLWDVVEKPEDFIGKSQESEKEAEKAPKYKDGEERALEERWPSPFKPHLVRIYIGTGALVHGAYGIGWRHFELQGTLGIVLDQKEVAENNKLEEKWMLGVPLGVRGQYYFFQNDLFQPYVMAGAMYALGISNYQSRFMGYVGIGQQVFKHFYGEVSYMLASETGSIVVGLGVKLEFN
ncbi:MAG: hypothetical protein CVV50_05810, partial [Spirochaetae bacterium HGW-Spirochaetae-6]